MYPRNSENRSDGKTGSRTERAKMIIFLDWNAGKSRSQVTAHSSQAHTDKKMSWDFGMLLILPLVDRSPTISFKVPSSIGSSEIGQGKGPLAQAKNRPFRTFERSISPDRNFEACVVYVFEFVAFLLLLFLCALFLVIYSLIMILSHFILSFALSFMMEVHDHKSYSSNVDAAIRN
jgi:hypothetical protein